MSVLDTKARELGRPVLEVVCRRLDRWNVSPDAVTLLGLVLTIGVAALAALGAIRWAGVAYLVAGACDALDGTLARISGKGSRFGAFLDSTIDRFEESLVLLGLATAYIYGDGTWEVLLILVVVMGSLMVSYTRARAEAIGVNCQVGFMTRVPRVALTILGMILNLVPAVLVLLSVTTLWTAVHRIIHVWRVTGGEAGGWGAVRDPFVLPLACSEGADPVSQDASGGEA